MSAISNKWATLPYQQSAPRTLEPARKAVLDAFAAFEPEAIGLETLAHETELSQAEVSTVLIDMLQRHELIVTVEYFAVVDGGSICERAYLPVNMPIEVTCYSFTMYRINKEWKQQ